MNEFLRSSLTLLLTLKSTRTSEVGHPGAGTNPWAFAISLAAFVALAGSSAVAFEVPLSEVAVRPEQITRVATGAVFVSHAFDGRYTVWSTDGTPAGTRELLDPCPLPCDGTPLIRILGSTNQGIAFFIARDPATLPEDSNLWRTDGTPVGTFPLLDTSKVGSIGVFGPESFAVVGARILFSFNSSIPRFIWASDGSVSGTGPIEGLPIPQFGDQIRICAAGISEGYFRIEFHGVGYSFYRTDGTSSGTSAPFSIPDVSVSCFRSIVSDGRFWAPSWQVAAPMLGLWTADGSASGTTFLGALPGNPFPIEVRNGSALFLVRDDIGGAPSLWTSDGTPAGTRMLKQGTRWESFEFSYSVRMFEIVGPFAYYHYTNDLDALEVRRIRLDGTDDRLIQTVCSANCQVTQERSWIESLGEALYFPGEAVSLGVRLFRIEPPATVATMVAIPCSSICDYRYDFHQVTASRLLFIYWDELAGDEFFQVGPADGPASRLSDFTELTPYTFEPFISPPLAVVNQRLLVPGGLLYAVPAFDSCNPSSSRLCVRQERFRILVHWRDFQSHEGTGFATPLTTDTGFFWFFDDANVELTVKVIDGTGINGHFWVFYGALSNIEYWLMVEDTVTGESKQYHNELGHFGSFGDIEALPAESFGTAPARAPIDPLPVPPQHSLSLIEAGSSGSCIPSPTRLCVLEGRFAVEANWTDFEGDSGVAYAQPLTSDTGYFWFFSASNVEIVAKLIDGSGFNDHFWVYYGALSNVEYTITVTDTVAGGPPRTYHNALGHFGSFGDIEAFPAP